MEQYLTNHVERLTAPAPRGLTVKLVQLLLCWQERWMERRRLSEMDETTLRDIGLSRADIDQEARKPFWQD